ncbi:ABC transporter substrate-binding protein [Rhodococcus sp. P1Y]|uniref:ABC transporter substrate-binding protein n=1 Tax=Rhodococcus sp. P1Y TaxID=1302308 RepID=UPI000EB503D0|nr:ABC transporter substrate-binding protein [Rhodococcus sp. P1Y]AYJ50304.1 ABC transporter substrate-binding protein [Rhodococcus sp. P1Y]
MQLTTYLERSTVSRNNDQRQNRLTTAVAALLGASVLVLAGCSTSAPGETAAATGATGDPVAGGAARAIQASEPRSLDPAAMTNTWTTQGFLGNALYGNLLINDVETTEIEGQMATDFSTDDGGATFTLTLRPDLVFSDGTPLDAEAVKFNWERLTNPALGSSSIVQAGTIAAIDVVDPVTLEATLVAPNPHYGQAVVNSSMNWIASPAALALSPESFNDKPIGAGPFTLVSWARQDVIELVKNPDYWDAPRPYLDSISVRTANDTNQRINTLMSGGADFVLESNWDSVAKAEASGYPTDVVPMGGGQYIAMNTRVAPFDDIRARQAVSMAIDLNSMNLATYNGSGQVPETLFPEGSPFHTDTALSKYDPEAAQKLFDELAAEGKPVSFTNSSFSTVENKASAESMQTQLSAYQNVDAQVDVVDFPTGLSKLASRDFQMMISSANIQHPDYALWQAFQTDSRGNVTGTSDPELDAALAAGRFASSDDERKNAYQVVQDRIVELTPGIFFTRAAPAVVTGKNVGGIHQYGSGSLLPAELWIQN